jgi:phage tail P2-like protein
VTSLLPKNATPLERALEDVAGERLDGLSFDFASLFDPATCPPAFLPYLAWERGVELWDEDFVAVDGEEDLVRRRREIIGRFDKIRRLRGTLAAIDLAMETIGVRARIREWWDHPEPKEPYTFKVILLSKDNRPLGEADRRRILRVIESLKPLRARFDLDIMFEAKATVGAAMFARVTRIKRLTAVVER